MSTSSPSPTEPRSFDAVLADLETCVRRLEAGGMSLTDAVATFERGVSLQQQCQELLDATERKIEELSPSSPAPEPSAP